MVLVVAYVRPHKLEEVKSALALLPISGLTVSDWRGRGNGEEPATTFLGQQMVISLPVRSRVEVVAPADLAEEVVEAIRAAAHTGQSGDGKIFVEPVADSVRVRTGERGEGSI